MGEQSQMLFMQTRLLRLASEKWKTSIVRANDIFAKYKIFQFIEDCFEEFHMEGDEAVFYDIEKLLRNKEVNLYAEID